jgi:hypothetical protein
MEPISNTTRVVMLLRQRLLERARTRGNGQSGSASSESTPRSAGMDVAQALAGVDGMEERHLRRALIQDILAHEFGPDLLNHAKFQQVVDNVTSAMEDDAEASGLLAAVVSDLRAAAR